MMTTSSYVFETTESTFAKDVIEKSYEAPVVLDFWAEWCGPCRLLGPILEKLANEYGGKFVVAKADTERVPGLAADFGVRSIPAVFALRDGKVVDSFVGVLPEAAIRARIDRLIPSPAEQAVVEAKRSEASDPAAAEAKYRAALALSPDEPKAKIGLARLLLSRGRLDEARDLVDELERRGFLEPEAEKLKAELALRGEGSGAGDIASARAAVAAKPSDLSLKLRLAEALAASGDYEAALETALDLVERDRKGVGEDARKIMLNIFQLLPDDSELLSEWRRKLAAALF